MYYILTFPILTQSEFDHLATNNNELVNSEPMRLTKIFDQFISLKFSHSLKEYAK
jgi:hypothetical protein